MPTLESFYEAAALSNPALDYLYSKIDDIWNYRDHAKSQMLLAESRQDHAAYVLWQESYNSLCIELSRLREQAWQMELSRRPLRKTATHSPCAV